MNQNNVLSFCYVHVYFITGVGDNMSSTINSVVSKVTSLTIVLIVTSPRFFLKQDLILVSHEHDEKGDIGTIQNKISPKCPLQFNCMRGRR